MRVIDSGVFIRSDLLSESQAFSKHGVSASICVICKVNLSIAILEDSAKVFIELTFLVAHMLLFLKYCSAMKY